MIDGTVYHGVTDLMGHYVTSRQFAAYITTVFENTYFMFFQISKKHDFLRFFEMMYQKVVKSR